MSEQEYAGFWIRLGAFLIDSIILMIIIAPVLTFIYGTGYWLGERQGVYGVWDVLLNFVFPIVVTIWFWLRFAATPGKMLCRLKIVNVKTGGELSLGQATGRYFAYIPAMLPLCLGLIWVGIDKKKQGWHDKLASTVVIRNRNKPKPVNLDSDAEK